MGDWKHLASPKAWELTTHDPETFYKLKVSRRAGGKQTYRLSTKTAYFFSIGVDRCISKENISLFKITVLGAGRITVVWSHLEFCNGFGCYSKW